MCQISYKFVKNDKFAVLYYYDVIHCIGFCFRNLPPMKHVLVDMHRLKQNPYNGLYTFSKQLGQSLAALSPEHLRLHFYLPRQQFGIFGGKQHYRAHHSIDKFFMARTARYDVWHATTTISWYRPFNRHTKFIFTVHDLNFLLEDAQRVKGNRQLLQRIQQRINRADHLTFISAYAKDISAQHLQLGDKPTSIIYNGCNMNQFTHFNSPRYQPSKPFLFTIGLVQPRKNFHLLPALLQHNNYELIIAGLHDFDYKKVVEAEIKKWGMTHRVRLIGPVTEEEKYWYYKNCAAFLFPSFAEGFGLPVLEAMQFGKPVFLSNQTCLPEIGGEVAYYFDNFDPVEMQQVFEKGMVHYSENDRMDKIRQRAAFFSWERSAAQYLQIYSTI